MRKPVQVVGKAWSRFPLPLGPAAMVLGYHHVSDHLDGAVRPAALAEQLAWLRSQPDLPVMSLDGAITALESGTAPARSVVLTFDDALADFHANALPLLRDAALPVTLYAPVGLLGSDPYMSVDQLRECAAAGVEIGGHSRMHADLRTCTDAELEWEVRGCRDDLEDMLGREVRSFAYPAGFFDARVEAAVRRARYRSAVTTRRGWLRRGANPTQVPRTFVEDAPLDVFRAAAGGGFNFLGLPDAVRGPARLGSAGRETPSHP